MLLTISQPPKTDFGSRYAHDFSPRISLAKSRLSPQPKIDSPVSSLRVSETQDIKMSTQHRGLPPISLPDPGRRPSSYHQPLDAMPNPPNQWQGQEESMRNWLVAKAEEDKRKQEEEKTKQETLRLDQRRIEQSMLREALAGGVPPTMVPMIYAGIGGSNLAQVSLDWVQQYAGQLQATHQQIQQQHASPELRREPRMISQTPAAYAQPPPQQVLPSQHEPQQPQQSQALHTTFSAYQLAPSRPPPTSAPRSATHTQLPRLTTNDMYVHQPTQERGPGSAHPLQQSQTIQQDQPTSSPSIYFHHWVPPNEAKNTQPQTPASKGEPLSAIPGSHLSESEYKESPRKRKAQGPHQPAPPPSAGPHHSSPPFGTGAPAPKKRLSHQRSGSSASMRENESRPDSRREQEQTQTSQPASGQPSEERRTSDMPAPVDERGEHSSLDLRQETDQVESRRPG